ncbi:PH domain-containing protein [Nocardioides taihuensis]|uniref:PH domain-containing protein n=1 Tax=Nocardioides taihuensis TaxID=1835606 RepID=A0ABW0BGL7_9ACTN
MTELPPPAANAGWRRLDTRMLLVHPIREVVRFLPVLVGLFVAGRASSGADPRWQLWGIAVPVGLGVLRYFTTTYRLDDERVELKRGLLDRHLLSVRLERIRTVDLTASVFHRMLGLTTVRIGTGTASSSDEDQLDLDGLPVDHAREMRAALLRRADPAAGAGDEPAVPDRVLLRLSPAWARYAPLTGSGYVLAAAALGVAAQVADTSGLFDAFDLERTAEEAAGTPTRAVVTLLVVLVLVTALAIVAYLVANWGFTLSRGGDGTWHVRRGLLTTRETSVDAERLTGVSLGEPLGLRLVGAARLAAIATGLDHRQVSSTPLAPPAPRHVVEAVGTDVVGSPGPVTGRLHPHGPAAARRRWVRVLVPAAVVTAGLVLAVVLGAPAALVWLALLPLPAALVVGVDRVRSLGHGRHDRHLVVRSGSLYRRRDAVREDSVIGWVFRATWFQRRAGLTTLVATVAGGRQHVTALDVPDGDAVSVAVAAVPGLVEQFLVPPPD